RRPRSADSSPPAYCSPSSQPSLDSRRPVGVWPIRVTENGAAYEDLVTNGVVEDPKRVDFVRRHLEALARAIAAGVDVRGYYVWSLLDNFEREHGYRKRFGIVYVDCATQRRTPSARLSGIET